MDLSEKFLLHKFYNFDDFDNTTVNRFLDYLFVEMADPRTIKWPLMHYPTKIILLVIFYYYFVKHLGPRLMKNREAFKLEKVLVIYNLLHVLFSGYLAYDVNV